MTAIFHTSDISISNLLSPCWGRTWSDFPVYYKGGYFVIVLYVYVCVCVSARRCVSACACVHACRGQRTTSAVTFQVLSTLFL